MGQPPSVTGISPASGPTTGGTLVTVTGSNFSGLLIKDLSVQFGTVQATCCSAVSPQELQAISPAAGEEGQVDLTVGTNDGTSGPQTFTYTQSPPTDPNLVTMMALSALAATSSKQRPSGETTEQQQARILAGINGQLAAITSQLSGSWQSIWVGLTQDRANLAYLAQNTSVGPGVPAQYALALRGTQGFLIDILEDLNVGTVLPFLGGNISQGAMQAFTEVTMGTSLLATLTEIFSGLSTPPVLFVTGHSLGGALATTVSLYLAAQTWPVPPSIQPYTFAAPTAGDAGFAAAFNTAFPAAACVWNQYDLVPSAWWNLLDSGAGTNSPPVLEAAEYYWPGMSATLEVETKGVVKGIAKAVGDNSYVQPNPPQRPPLVLNACLTSAVPASADISTFEDWVAELGYQHNSYLALLGGPAVPAQAPTVTGVNPSQGPVAGWTPVTIAGNNFTPDSVVDFGVVPATVLTVVSPDSITALAPPGAGIVDVAVTSMYGTSAATKDDQFTYLLTS